MGILAANAYNPGFCPLILNLIRSTGKFSYGKQSALWLVEYAHGLEHEIYCVSIFFCNDYVSRLKYQRSSKVSHLNSWLELASMARRY
jgi:hypothetical protein